MEPGTQLDGTAAEEGAVPHDLVERIVRSPYFSKSPRLIEFLRYVCVLAEAGRFSEINEQMIGEVVFGRSPDYDPSIDSIVRSHASRLRHRLRDYFENEGVDESSILTIPKGSYIPRLHARTLPSTEPTDPAVLSMVDEVGAREIQLEGVADGAGGRSEVAGGSAPGLHGSFVSQQRQIVALRIGLVVMLCVVVALLASVARGWHGSARKAHLLSKQLLTGGSQNTLVVGADSGLVMLQHFTRRPVSLASYMNRDYMRDFSSPGIPEAVVRKLASRRYMPVIDQSIYDLVSRTFADSGDTVSFRYARDLRLEELKQRNAILLGSRESNPWVQLFEPTMNFYFQSDLQTGAATMLNRHPAPGEQLRYDMSDGESEHTVYGLIVYRPNLSQSGHVLILEGQTMAGTQTASDFVLDDSYLLPFIEKIRRSNGEIPPFELLLRSTSLGGESSRIETVAHRVSAE